MEEEEEEGLTFECLARQGRRKAVPRRVLRIEDGEEEERLEGAPPETRVEEGVAAAGMLLGEHHNEREEEEVRRTTEGSVVGSAGPACRLFAAPAGA